MPDIFTKAKRSAVMAAIRGRGNKGTELRMMALLRAHGITGWRRQQRIRIAETGKGEGAPRRGRSALRVPRSAFRLSHVSVDFVFRRERVVVFVDGCFWHACPRHGTMPVGNRAFWKAKLTRNVVRDRDVTRSLRKAGWRVLRVWECALSAKLAVATMRRIVRALARADP